MSLKTRMQTWLRHTERRGPGPRRQPLVLELLEARDLFATGLTALDLASLNLKFTSPDVSRTSTPTITVHYTGLGAPPGVVDIDADLNHDGQFTGPGESDIAQVTLTNDTGTVTLPTLPDGTFTLQARFDGGNGHGATSQFTIDPNAGYVGIPQFSTLVSDFDATGGHPSKPFFLKYHLLQFDTSNRIAIQVRSVTNNDFASMKTDLANLGMTILSASPTNGVVAGYIGVDSLAAVSQVATVADIVPVYKTLTNTGAAESQGDGVINGPPFRTATGVTGAGVTVGVLSDSVNEFGGGIAQSQATGDLPPNVNVIQDDPAGNGTDEGRAMLEIVHDVAPGASLAFATGDVGGQGFADNIRALAAAGAKSITDDLTEFDEPMFNDGLIAQAVDQVEAQGVFYSSSAGNEGNSGWQDTYKPIATTIGKHTLDPGVTGTFQNFGGAGTPSPFQSITVPAGGEILIDFQWDNAYLEGGSNLPNFQVPTQMTAFVTDADGTHILATFNTNGPATNQAFQLIDFVNTGNASTSFNLAFQQSQGPAPTRLRWVAITNGFDDPHAAGEGSGSTIFGHPVAAGAVAVGAVPWFNPSTPESFTSVGGEIPILFDAAGNRLSTPQFRFKPEVAGPDGVSTTFFVPGTNSPPDGFPKFFGTSAAAPHVAAAAALLIAQNPALTPTQVTTKLEQTAIDVPPGGKDNLTGFGLIQLTFTGPLNGSAVNKYHPFRYIVTPKAADPSTADDFAGNITLYNRSSVPLAGNLAIILVGLPPGVTVSTDTGPVPAVNGTIEIPLPVSNLPAQDPVRIPIILHNPRHLPISTFFQGFGIILTTL